jgi:hypothetical protein
VLLGANWAGWGWRWVFLGNVPTSASQPAAFSHALTWTVVVLAVLTAIALPLLRQLTPPDA